MMKFDKLIRNWKFWLTIAIVVVLYLAFFYNGYCIPCLQVDGSVDSGICHTLYQELTGVYAIC